MYKAYKDRVEFLLVYIREAHPSDGWQVSDNEKDGVVLKEPKSHEERQSVAQKGCTQLKLSMPTVIDDMDNSVDEKYAAWPERMFIVGPDGKVAYAGKQGPFGFKPPEVLAWLKDNVGPPKK